MPFTVPLSNPAAVPDIEASAAPADGFAAPVAEAFAAVDATARAVDGRVRNFVVRRPVVSLLGALAGGFLIGRLLSRA